MGKTYPEIDRLKAAVKECKLVLAPVETETFLLERSYRRVLLSGARGEVCVPVCDEFGDADEGRPIVLLQLILQECEWFEESEDYLVWAKDSGFEAADDQVRGLWLELREIVPRIRLIVGSKLRGVSAWDMEMNTSVAQALRQA